MTSKVYKTRNRAPSHAMRVCENISFARFVYPFVFRSELFDSLTKSADGSADTRNNNASANAAGVGAELLARAWQVCDFEVGDILPHVAELLAPGSTRTNGRTVARRWVLTKRCLSKMFHSSAKGTWEVKCQKNYFPIEITDVQLALFPYGAGFLTISAHPRRSVDPRQSLDNWLDFIHAFRYVEPKGYTDIRFKPIPGVGISSRNVEEGSTRIKPIIERLLKTIKLKAGTLRQGIDGMLDRIDGAATCEPGNDVWWEEVYIPGQLIPFVALYLDNVPRDEIEMLIFRIRSFFFHNQITHPAHDQLCLDHADLLTYADKMWFTFSLAGGAFVAINPPKEGVYRTSVAKKALPQDYFLLFLLALQQRFVLSRLAKSVAETWLSDIEREQSRTGGRGRRLANSKRTDHTDSKLNQDFEEISDVFFSFTAKGYFAQVMQGERHHLYYRQWQRTFEVEQLYQQVRDRISDMRAYIETRQERNLNTNVMRLTSYTVILGSVGAVAGWYGINVDEKTGIPPLTSSQGVYDLLLLVLAIVAIEIVFFKFKRWL